MNLSCLEVWWSGARLVLVAPVGAASLTDRDRVRDSKRDELRAGECAFDAVLINALAARFWPDMRRDKRCAVCTGHPRCRER